MSPAETAFKVPDAATPATKRVEVVLPRGDAPPEAEGGATSDVVRRLPTRSAHVQPGHDDLRAARGVLMGMVLGAGFWLGSAWLAVRWLA